MIKVNKIILNKRKIIITIRYGWDILKIVKKFRDIWIKQNKKIIQILKIFACNQNNIFKFNFNNILLIHLIYFIKTFKIQPFFIIL